MLNDENNNGNYILIAEDSPADVLLYHTAFTALKIKNRIVFVENGELAYQKLKSDPETPFVIISDINMPAVNGIELKQKIQSDLELQVKSIPFIFMTSSASTEEVLSAYRLSAQGYFLKPMEYNEFEKLIDKIYNYWAHAQLPKVISL